MTKVMPVRRYLWVRTHAMWKPLHWLVDLLYKLMGRFVHGAVFNAGGSFGKKLQILVCWSFPVSLSSLMLNLFWTWEWSGYRGFSKTEVPLGCLYYFHTKACCHMTSDGDLYHVGPSKLICETKWWTGPYVMRYLAEGYSEHTMILHLCGSGKNTSVLCFSIGGCDTGVASPSRT